MTTIRKRINADGTEQELPVVLPMSAIAVELRATALDHVNLHHMGQPLHVLIVDDHGASKRLPINPGATALYRDNCRPEARTRAFIYGDAFLCPDSDFVMPGRPL